MSLLKHTSTIGGLTLVSRAFGFLRDILQAAIIGANAYSDVFFVAFKLPNFFRRIFAEGAFNAAFVPLFTDTLAAHGPARGRQFAAEAMAVLIMALLVLTAIIIIIMPWFMYLLAPGFADNPGQFDLAVLLTRITFPYLLFISLVSLLGSILNGMDKFAAVAATPILMNLCFIAALLLIWVIQPEAEMTVIILSIGVTLSGVAQFSWLVYFCRKVGMMPGLMRPRLTQDVRKMLKLIGPAAIGGSVAQINLMIGTIIASFLPAQGSISFLYYADRIMELPLAVIGIAIGTALLPMLSRQLREGKLEIAHHSQNRAIELSMLLCLPAAAALMVIANPIITVLFEHGAFSAADTAATSSALIAFSFGLPAFVLIKVLSPGFYANHDTATPFKIASFCILINLILNLALMEPLAHTGLALGTSLAGWVNAVMMAVVLYKRKIFLPDALLKSRMPRMLAASALMALALASINPWLAAYWESSLPVQIIALGCLVGIGLSIFAASVWVFKATDVGRLTSLMQRNKKD